MQKCGRPTKSKGIGEEKKIRHLPVNGRKCYLIICPKRRICDDCNSTTNQRLKWYNYKCKYTKEYIQHMMLLLVNSTLEDVSQKENIYAETIRRMLNNEISGSVNWSSFKKFGVIGIDEISVKKRYQDFRTIVTSRINGKTIVLAVLPDRKKCSLMSIYQNIPPNLRGSIDCICCDMYDSYISATIESLPKVSIITDRFHVAKLSRKCIVEVRKSELSRLRNKMSKEKYNSLKLSISILRRNSEIVNKEKRAELEKLFYYSNKLRKAHRLCRHLTAIYNSKM